MHAKVGRGNFADPFAVQEQTLATRDSRLKMTFCLVS